MRQKRFLDTSSRGGATRREFVKTVGAATSLTALTSTLPRTSWAHAIGHPSTARIEPGRNAFETIDEAHDKALVQRALDAARAAGASYADVRITRQRSRLVGTGIGVPESAGENVGVRALVDGYWGFCSSAICTAESVVLTAKDAVALAKTTGLGRRMSTSLVPVPVFSDATWTMPVEIDPFTVDVAEVGDMTDGLVLSYKNAWARVGARVGGARNGGSSGGTSIILSWAEFWKQIRVFGTTEGHSGRQVLYRSGGGFMAGDPSAPGGFRLDFLSPAGVGWELFRSRKIHEDMDRALEAHFRNLSLPVKSVDLGRHQLVIDAETTAQLLSTTIGAATELDRALGFEANSGGSSYLDNPMEMVGQYIVGSPILNVTSTRSDPGGVATVGWDDEGVRAHDTTLVKNGVLHAFQTTREGAAWIRENVRGAENTLESTGSASAPTGNETPLVQTGNLILSHADTDGDIDALIGSVDRGVVFEQATVTVDYQQLNGLCVGRAYEVKGGKKVAQLLGAGILFRTPELWKNLTMLGGRNSIQRFGLTLRKGHPEQDVYHSVTTPPVIVKDIPVIDVRRR